MTDISSGNIKPRVHLNGNGGPQSGKRSPFKIKNQIWIEPDMFYSEAFMELSASAIRTLLRCLQKRKWDKLKVNGRRKNIYRHEGFIFPYIEAAFLKIGTTQHWKNLKSLVEKGFIDIVHQGGWYQKHERERDYSVYMLSERWRQYGTPDFKKVEKPKVLQTEYYVRENIERKSRATSGNRRSHLRDNEGDDVRQQEGRLHETKADEV